MATERQSPGGAYVVETGTRQAQSPDGAYVLETASTSATGTVAATNANDAAAASGTTTVVGTSARTNASDTPAASGSTTVLGTSATTNAADTSSANGTSTVQAASATTNANDTGAATGSSTVTGTVAATNAADTNTASGAAGNITGTVAATNANDASSAAGNAVGAVVDYSGGWFDTPARKRKTKAEIRLEREEWGVLPKKAKALIQRVAAQQVERVEEPDNTEALIAAFNRAELAFKEEFRVLYQREIERQLAKMREEEEILLLLH